MDVGVAKYDVINLVSVPDLSLIVFLVGCHEIYIASTMHWLSIVYPDTHPNII